MPGSGASSSFPEGARLGKYRLVAKLGTGGMAEVLLARIEGPAGFTKTVAIKRMREELTDNKEFVDLFLQEARTAAMLSHPNICHIHELTCVDGQYFIVMEYLEGVPLSSIMRQTVLRPGRFGLPLFAGLVVQACEGLHHAHEMNDEAGRPLHIIHRDVSPPNLFVTTGGVVKVLDFGISKSKNSQVRTLTGQVRGKFSYMSPEQIRGTTADRRTDVFSLGIILFELVTGRRLFRRRNRMQVIQAIVRDPIPSALEVRPDLPPRVGAVIDRALARDRRRRFATAREMGEALADAVSPLGGPSASTEIAEAIQCDFAAELETKPGMFSADEQAAPAESPMTTNLRPPQPLEVTIPDGAAAPARDFPDTLPQASTTHDTRVDVKPAPPADDFEDDGPIPPPPPEPGKDY